LTEMIVRVVRDVERTTKLQWNESAYTTVAVRHAIDGLLRHWGASGEPKVPLAIKELAKRQPLDYAKKFEDPAEVGSWAAGRLITEIEAQALIEGEGPHKLPADFAFPGQPPEWGYYRRTVIPRLGSRWKERKPIR